MTPTQSPLSWLIVVAVVAATVLIVAYHRKRTSWGFKDVVKNPEYWDDVAEAMSKAEAAADEAKGWDDEQTASFTRQFILGPASIDDDRVVSTIIKALGERTHAPALALLRDSALRRKLVKRIGEGWRSTSPFGRACDLLGDAPPGEAVEVVAPFLQDPSLDIREQAAMTIAKTGTDAMIPLVKRALSGQNKDVCSSAIRGLDTATSRMKLSARACAELYDDVLALLKAGRDADRAALVLYRLNPGGAKSYFLSPEIFSADSPILHDVLPVLADAKESVPPDNLRTVIASLAGREMKYPNDLALGEALRLLGLQPLMEDRELLQRFATHTEERVVRGAAAGLLALSGLDGFEKKMWDKERQGGYESLTKPQQLYIAVCHCDGEVLNGGFAQYFVNSTGNYWPEAMAGFKAMGFGDRLAIFSDAVALFGPAGPSTDRGTRQIQLATISEGNDSILSSLDGRYYDSPEVLERFTSKYVMENADAFR